jgi:hypothetical protein
LRHPGAFLTAHAERHQLSHTGTGAFKSMR